MPPNRAARRGGAEAVSVTIKVDGQPYVLHPDEIDHNSVRMFRAATGMSVRAAMEVAEADPDIDIIAALVWLARRQGGEPELALEDVNLDYRSELDVVDEDPEAGEGPAANSGGSSRSSRPRTGSARKTSTNSGPRKSPSS